MNTKALRQKILDLAIRGKLVPQDPNDEPASVLLERIRAEKQQMVKDGKLKAKDIKNDTVIFLGDDNLHYEKFPDGTVKSIEDEIPFELPEVWEWCKLRNICFMIAGKSKSKEGIKSEAFEGCYPCYGGNGQRGYVDTYNYDGKYSIIGRQGALCGNVNVAEGRFYATEHAVVVTLYDNIDFYWNTFILEALNINQYATGAAQPGLSVANVLNILVPLPPYKEQLRIADNLTKSIEIINRLDADKTDLQDTIQLTKSKILDLAIRGKLVPQNPNDEPASVLLDRIRAEKEELIKQGKIKRDKKESVIYKGDDNSYYEKIGDTVTCIDEELPFELPDGWIWCRGSSCFLPMESQKPSGTYFKYIDIDSIDNKHQAIKEAKITETAKAPSRANRAVYDGSILFSLVRPYLKNIALVDSNNADSIASTGFYIATSNGTFIPKYLYILMISAYVVDGLNQFMKGDNSPSISKDNIEKWLYPVPPLAEQEKIANTVQKYLSILEDIEKSLS